MSLIMKIVLCQIRSEIEARVVQPTTPRTVSSFFAGVILCGRAVVCLLCLDVLLFQSVYPNIQRKSVWRPSRLSVANFSVWQYEFRNENSIWRLVKSADEEERYHTHVYLLLNGYIQQKMYYNPLLVMSDSLYLFIDFHNENAFSSLWQETSPSRTQSMTTMR